MACEKVWDEVITPMETKLSVWKSGCTFAGPLHCPWLREGGREGGRDVPHAPNFVGAVHCLPTCSGHEVLCGFVV